MAKYDLPAVIDYVLNKTSETQLTYVGHSQGVATLLILCSKVPQCNNKIKVGFGLSATAWLDHARFIIVQMQDLLHPLLTWSGGLLNVEILPRGGVIQFSAKLLFGLTKLTYPLCSNIIFVVLDVDHLL